MTTLKNLPVAPVAAMLIALGTAGSVQAKTIYGETQPLGDGFIRSFVELDDDGNPSDIGIAFTQEALSLPIGDDAPDIKTQLSLPPEASATPFTHLELIYRPYDSPGNPEVFFVPRFSIEFFQISPEERELICPNPDTSGPQPTCVGDELAKVLKSPEPGTAPEGFQPTFWAQPGYGTRYFDPEATLPIVEGKQPFTTLYDYGYYDGKPSLISFGSTKAFLETQNLTTPIKVPSSYPKSSYYPTSYTVEYHAPSQEYRMSLSGLTYRSVPEVTPTLGLLALVAWGALSQVKNKLQRQNLASR